MKRILVTIGHPGKKEYLLPCEIISVEEGKEIEAAKKLRKEVAENIGHFGFPREIRFNPSDFYYAIFEDFDDVKPIFASDNWFCRIYKEFSQKNLQQRRDDPVGQQSG